jgi:hypothetical protein
MPDTGAPFNIPFAEPSNLVRDWPALSEDVADAVAAGLAIGLGTNVVQTVKSDTFSTSSTSYTDVTGMSVTITPSSADSKVLVVATLSLGRNGDTEIYVQLLRGSTPIAIGDTAGDRTRATFMSYNGGTSASSQSDTLPVYFLDSPGVGTATTYKLQMRVGASTGFVNRNGGDADAAANPRNISTITAIEVAA